MISSEVPFMVASLILGAQAVVPEPPRTISKPSVTPSLSIRATAFSALVVSQSPSTDSMTTSVVLLPGEPAGEEDALGELDVIGELAEVGDLETDGKLEAEGPTDELAPSDGCPPGSPPPHPAKDPQGKCCQNCCAEQSFHIGPFRILIAGVLFPSLPCCGVKHQRMGTLLVLLALRRLTEDTT